MFLDNWFTMLDDSPIRKLKGRITPRVSNAFVASINSRPLMQSLKFLSSLSDRILDSSDRWSLIEIIPDMKRTPLIREFLHFLDTGDPSYLEFILSFLIFGKKLRVEDSSFYDTAFREWLGVEERIGCMKFSPNDSNVILLRWIIGDLLSGFTLSPLVPKFGPGKVSESYVKNVDDKFDRLIFHKNFLRLLQLSGLDNQECLKYLKFICLDKLGDEREPPAIDVNGFISRLKFVPKDISKSRSICMEPNVLMYVQQSILHDFVICFRGGLMRRFVDLNDQVPNQRAAEYGSLTGLVDTIDLSSASDSVNWDLVRLIFPDEIVEILGLTRSYATKIPDGTTYPMKKFAPMGSALCFPIQCIIFTGLCILSGIRIMSDRLSIHSEDLYLNLRRDSYHGLFHDDYFYDYYRGRFEPPRVFGDDICIDTHLTDTLITFLGQFGFIVNKSKSFIGGNPNRESCGKYYHKGHDITPVRFLLGFRSSLHDAKAMSSQIAYTNNCFDKGYLALRRLNIKQLHKWNRKISFIGDDSNVFGIKSEKPLNRHLKLVGRHDRQPKGCHAYDYQRTEMHCVNDIKKGRILLCTQYSDPYLYMRWWAERSDDSIKDPYGSSHRTIAPGSRVKLGWTPA